MGTIEPEMGGGFQLQRRFAIWGVIAYHQETRARDGRVDCSGRAEFGCRVD